MSSFGVRNELRHYNQRRRNERIQNGIAALFFVGFVVYIVMGMLP